MPILKLEIFQNSKSQNCELWGRPPPFSEEVHNFFFFFCSLPLLILSPRRSPVDWRAQPDVRLTGRPADCGSHGPSPNPTQPQSPNQTKPVDIFNFIVSDNLPISLHKMGETTKQLKTGEADVDVFVGDVYWLADLWILTLSDLLNKNILSVLIISP